VTADEWRVLALTLRTAALAVAVILPPGLALAWLLARRTWPGKALVETLLALPLVMPPVATGLILLRLLGRRSALGGWFLRVFDADIVFTWRAVVAAMAVMALPLLVRSARHAFEGVDPRIENVARTLGASWPRILRELTLPLAARGILGGVLLAFARALGEFGATILVAGNIPGRTRTLALAIYDRVQLGDDAAAGRLLVIAVVVAFLAVWSAEWFLRRRSRP
jgi:molybdate transport system permease protein